MKVMEIWIRRLFVDSKAQARRSDFFIDKTVCMDKGCSASQSSTSGFSSFVVFFLFMRLIGTKLDAYKSRCSLTSFLCSIKKDIDLIALCKI